MKRGLHLDPDPTFHADADPAPDPKLFSWKVKKNSSKSSPIRSKILPSLSCVIFLATILEEGSGVRDKEVGEREEAETRCGGGRMREIREKW